MCTRTQNPHPLFEGIPFRIQSKSGDAYDYLTSNAPTAVPPH